MSCCMQKRDNTSDCINNFVIFIQSLSSANRKKVFFFFKALSIDNIKNTKFLSPAELGQAISFQLDSPFFMVTLHPVTLEKNTALLYINALLKALDGFQQFKVIFTKSNANNV